jgi:uncharacterized lipoprotein YmbA
MKFLKGSLIVSFILLLMACTSTQKTNFYLLKAIPDTDLKISSITGVTILVQQPTLPEYLDQPQMVLRENDYKLQMNEDHRWAEPIKNNFTRVFVENLNTRVAPSNASVFSELGRLNPDYQLSIKVLQMDVNMDDKAVLKTEWALYNGKEEKLIKRQNSSYTLPVDTKSYESGVEAQSKAIALLAEEIAETIKKVHNSLLLNKFKIKQN